ncbi:hypothetical protein O6H91_10G052300 [Diphasiastrum complanatum]|uniref:Uncharacterized protein n=1 Tax=Diphasiastrum complanatum TaxID=34168 RepID=A0ACC2CH95_DIPCM|nr:hypothetical protein O6H91_10G052300 [Diphasiastrum complanatum]
MAAAVAASSSSFTIYASSSSSSLSRRSSSPWRHLHSAFLSKPEFLPLATPPSSLLLSVTCLPCCCCCFSCGTLELEATPQDKALLIKHGSVLLRDGRWKRSKPFLARSLVRVEAIASSHEHNGMSCAQVSDGLSIKALRSTGLDDCMHGNFVASEGKTDLCVSSDPSDTRDFIVHDSTAMLSDVKMTSCEGSCIGSEASISGSDSIKSISSTDESLSEHRMRWSMLLSTGVLLDAHLTRAGSVTDAHVLRRKGRLKEQDGLIEFIISMHTTHSPSQVMEKMERWIREHFEDPRRSTLRRLVPPVGRFYTPLPLSLALQEYDEFAFLSRRKYVPPNFAEIRHILNIGQVHAIAENLSLLTFDADGTLYADGHHIERDNKMIGHIIKFMQQNIHIAIVTAAGYPEDAGKFEHRVAGLLAAFRDLCLPSETMSYFHVMGGECNYLLKVDDNYRLEFVPDEFWKSTEMNGWSEDDVQTLLDDAERALRSAAARLKLEINLVRKPRSVGAIPREPTIYEVLEEMALTVQVQLVDARLPFCAFNGGNGNKSIGLGALMKYFGKKPNETLHVGDRFTLSGNDSATRSKCPILWVANPEETGFFTRLLLNDIQVARLIPYIE